MQAKKAEMQNETIDSKVIALNEEKEFENYLSASNTKILLIDFYSEQCPPCKTLAPYLDAYSKVNDDQYTFLKIDIVKFPILGQKYNVKNIPTLVIIKNREEIARKIGPVEILDYCKENLKSFEKQPQR